MRSFYSIIFDSVLLKEACKVSDPITEEESLLPWLLRPSSSSALQFCSVSPWSEILSMDENCTLNTNYSSNVQFWVLLTFELY